MRLIAKPTEDWWEAQNVVGKRGFVPSSYVSELPDAPPRPPHSGAPPVGKVLALYDYSAMDEGELTFAEGMEINLLSRDESGWWLGEAEGKEGLFPANYVQEVPAG